MSIIRRNFSWILAIVLYCIFVINIFYQNHKEELLEMTNLEAMLLIEQTKDMWKEVKQIG